MSASFKLQQAAFDAMFARRDRDGQLVSTPDPVWCDLCRDMHEHDACPWADIERIRLTPSSPETVE